MRPAPSDASLFGEVARDRVALAAVDERGLLLGADVLRLPAAGPEPAPARRVDRARHVAFEHDPLPRPLLARVRHGHRGQQRLRVRVAGVLVQVVGRRPISTILPRYITATWSRDVAHDREVVRDEHVRELTAAPAGPRAGSRTPAWIDTSSADTGSSSTTRSGSSASARAMPMRCRCPPENSCGNRFACSGLQADDRHQLRAPAPSPRVAAPGS